MNGGTVPVTLSDSVLSHQGQETPTDMTSHVNSQIWRSQPLSLAVTLEAAVLCNMSQGLSYTWTIVDAEATAVTLPAAVNTLGRTIMLPGYTLECGNYTATAQVGSLTVPQARWSQPTLSTSPRGKPLSANEREFSLSGFYFGLV